MCKTCIRIVKLDVGKCQRPLSTSGLRVCNTFLICKKRAWWDVEPYFGMDEIARLAPSLVSHSELVHWSIESSGLWRQCWGYRGVRGRGFGLFWFLFRFGQNGMPGVCRFWWVSARDKLSWNHWAAVQARMLAKSVHVCSQRKFWGIQWFGKHKLLCLPQVDSIWSDLVW